MPSKWTLAKYGCPGIMAASVALISASTFTDYWVTLSYENKKTDDHGGLATFCRVYDDSVNCGSYGDQTLVTDARKETRIFCFVAIGCASLSLDIMGYFSSKKCKVKKMMYGWVASFLSLGAFFSAFSGVIHFVKEQNEINYPETISFRFNYSLHMAWLAAILALVGGISFFFVAKYYSKRQKETQWNVSAPIRKNMVSPVAQMEMTLVSAYPGPLNQNTPYPPQYLITRQITVIDGQYQNQLVAIDGPYQIQPADQIEYQSSTGSTSIIQALSSEDVEGEASKECSEEQIEEGKQEKKEMEQNQSQVEKGGQNNTG